MALIVVIGLVFVIFSAGGFMPPSANNPKPVDNSTSTSPTPVSQVPEIDSPASNEAVSSPLTVAGKAPGNWFFEASMPIRLLDADGNLIASVAAQAQGDWMTTDLVPFSATLTFNTASTTPTGTLIIAKDNPSGLPENDQQISLPLRFER